MSDSSAAPTVQVEDNEGDATEFGPEAIKELVAQAIRENPVISLEDLRQVVHEELSKMDMDPGLMQEAVMQQLNMALHGQAKNFAEHAANTITENLRAEYAAHQEAQRWGTGKKVLMVGGAAVGGGLLYFLGRHNGKNISNLENG